MNRNRLIDTKGFFYKAFREYAEKFLPFEWDTVKGDFRSEHIDKNDLLFSFYRFYKVMSEVKERMSDEEISIIDFGVFPGVLPKLFRELLPKKEIKYCGIGLGSIPAFAEEMKKINVSLIETELDPFYVKPKKVVPIEYKGADFVLFLDVIEHLANPIHALDSANRCLKKDGIMILTTDNITCKENLLSMLMGKTPLLHPLETNMFFIGDWRPHFREYSKVDLVWLLNHCGFKVEKHEYFYRRQGEYSVINGHLTRKKIPSDKYYGKHLLKK